MVLYTKLLEFILEKRSLSPSFTRHHEGREYLFGGFLILFQLSQTQS